MDAERQIKPLTAMDMAIRKPPLLLSEIPERMQPVAEAFGEIGIFNIQGEGAERVIFSVNLDAPFKKP